MSNAFIEQSLFRPFRSTKKDGMGIGLFQSRMIVEAHGGTMNVESEEGHGTTFQVRLPVAQSVYQGGKGAMEVALRFSSIDLTDGLIDGGEMDVATAQFNWWFSRSMALSLNYRRTWTDRFDREGEMDAFVARVMLILQ